MSDPKAVAQAYYEASYGCGEEGAGRQYDLASSPSYDRNAVLRAERRDGCKPQRVPDLRVGLLAERGDFASVEVFNPDAWE